MLKKMLLPPRLVPVSLSFHSSNYKGVSQP